MSDPIVIVAATRSPLGSLLGNLKSLTAPTLGAATIAGALQQISLAPDRVQEVIMGCVLSAGLGQAPARQAALGAGIPNLISCTTVNKMCGSGMKAVMLAHDSIQAGTNDCVIAGGLESMSNAPYLLPRARSGYRMGHGQLLDHMFIDGLEDAYEVGRLMGSFAEDTANQYGFTREQQDQFAITSLQRAQQATRDGIFTQEITPIKLNTKEGQTTVTFDEQPGKADFVKIPLLKPAFSKNGTITAANSSSISDGAAVLILMKRSLAEQHGITPLAQIVAHASHAKQPAQFTTAPIGAIQTLLQKSAWNINDVDLFEINEAFAVVTMAAMHDLKLSHEIVNVHGGACALGHPIGASGARILVTLLNALKIHGLKRGIAALCIGGGEATAMAVELCH